MEANLGSSQHALAETQQLLASYSRQEGRGGRRAERAGEQREQESRGGRRAESDGEQMEQ